MSWACLQLGSREHYAIPAALHEAGQLDRLFTDSWMSVTGSWILKPFLPSLAGRRRSVIPDSLVRSRTLGRIWKDVEIRFRKEGAWEGIMRRNEWFGRWVTEEMEDMPSTTVFSFAYTARKPFQAAGKRGVLKILDQIDGAWREENLWRELSSSYHSLEMAVDRAPKIYWDLWREELDMADVIVVNSEWSKKLVVESGADSQKMAVIPLVYTAPKRASEDKTSDRVKDNKRLQALFLGTVCLRKGVGQLFDAIRMMASEPIDFIFAGPISVRVPDDIQAMPHVWFLGSVDRGRAGRLYEEADVFLFPTLSDGFGLTQLEALGHGLPVIASTHCAQVVEDRINGLVLSEITPEAIAEAVMELVNDRDLLASLKSRAKVPDHFHPRHLAPALLALEAAAAGNP